MKTRLLVACLSCLPIATTAAQVCAGSASFQRHRYHVSSTISFMESDATTIGAAVGLGGRALFGEAGVAKTSFQRFDASLLTISAGGGYDWAMKYSLLHICPVAFVNVLSGPHDFDFFGDSSAILDFNETDLIVGLHAGASTSSSARFQVLLGASVSYVYATVRIKDQISGTSDADTEAFGLLGLSVGLVFNDAVAIRPRVSVPFEIEGALTTYSVTLTVGFGSGAR